ncbi:MAG: hypothetical protein ACHQJ6_07575 [Candidatus Berkiellales bacterium]
MRKIFDAHNINPEILAKSIKEIADRAAKLNEKSSLWDKLHGYIQGSDLHPKRQKLVINHLQSIVDGIFASQECMAKFMPLNSHQQKQILADITEALSKDDIVMNAKDARECATIVVEITEKAIERAQMQQTGEEKRPEAVLHRSRKGERAPSGEKEASDKPLDDVHKPIESP